MADETCGYFILRADVTVDDVTIGIEDTDVVGNVAEPDASAHPSQADEVCSLKCRLIGTVRENLILCAGLSSETNDEGRALLAVPDLSQDIGVADETDNGRILVCGVFLYL